MFLAYIVFFAPFQFRSSGPRQEAQQLNCYDYTGQGGNSLVAVDYIPDLGQYGFDNIASSCCFQV